MRLSACSMWVPARGFPVLVTQVVPAIRSAVQTAGKALGQEDAARLEAAHGRMAAALELPDERLDAVGLAPWHERVTLLRAVSGLAWHDGMHLGMLRESIGRAAD